MVQFWFYLQQKKKQQRKRQKEGEMGGNSTADGGADWLTYIVVRVFQGGGVVRKKELGGDLKMEAIHIQRERQFGLDGTDPIDSDHCCLIMKKKKTGVWDTPSLDQGREEKEKLPPTSQLGPQCDGNEDL